VIKLLGEGCLERNAIIVASITGEGLNQPEALNRWAPEPHEVAPDLESLNTLLTRVASEDQQLLCGFVDSRDQEVLAYSQCATSMSRRVPYIFALPDS
jgi:hypothetical protein